ncbi:MAG: YbdK family carboxylate-amine ligase [Actinomycetota bacterium]|nr:YbdK family carboxylate-amine ligase [Actinomycetota bacterium]MDQ5807594.1 YbdK family carboxylate-amine ligase [Actinomycetota bacterium]
MAIDLAAAREAFAHSKDGTVGLEEEFAILDPETLELVPRFEELRDLAPSTLGQQITGELIKSEIEIVSGRGEDFRDAVAKQRGSRRLLFDHAADSRVALGATGTHPFSDYREQEFIDTEHYRRVADGLQWVAKRNNTFSLHVHVGVNGADRAVRTCDRLRTVLPGLLAISASSPFLDGIDSGLHSARTQMFTRTFPRCGVPDAYGGWDAYAEYIDFLVRSRSIVEYTQVWWSVRPHFSFGTVEVRICDAQPTAHESEALAALVVACVLQAAADVAEGRWTEWERVPNRLIEENTWRAIRFGMDGRYVNPETGEEREARGVLEDMLEWTAPARAEHGLPEPAFPERNSAQRQRALIAEGLPPRDVYAATVRETRESYAQEVPTT